MTDNTMAKGQITISKVLHRTVKIKQHERPSVNSGVPERVTVLTNDRV